MVKENTMKQTEIGLMPEDWEVTTLSNSVFFLDGMRRPIKSNERKSGQYPYYGASGIIDYVEDYIFDDELILLGEDGENILSRNLPLAFLVKGKIWVNNHAHVLKPKEDFHIKFLCEYLESLDYSLLNSGTAQPKLNKQACLNIKIAVPPLPEQEAIAEALSDADAWIESLEQLIAKKCLIKQGAMQELLTPKDDWEVKKLGEVCEIIKGKQFNSSLLNEVSPYPCYSGGISPSGYSEKYNELENTIIISEGGNSCGFVNFVTTKFWLGGHCYKVVLKQKNAVQDFYYQLLKYNQSTIMDLRVGSGLPNIQKKALSDFDISLPKSLTEQTHIATILSDMDAEQEALQAQLAKARQIKQGMMQELLTGRVRLV